MRNNQKQAGVLFRILPIAILIAVINVVATFMFYSIGVHPMVASIFLIAFNLVAAKLITLGKTGAYIRGDAFQKKAEVEPSVVTTARKANKTMDALLQALERKAQFYSSINKKGASS